MRLIDADNLLKKLDPEYLETMKLIKSGETHLNNLAEGYHEVHDLIVWEPTVDAEPVRRGHWFDVGSLSCRCSACGCKSVEESPYCPHCGARMEDN